MKILKFLTVILIWILTPFNIHAYRNGKFKVVYSKSAIEFINGTYPIKLLLKSFFLNRMS